MRYLTFEEYQELGGKCTENAFPMLQTDVETKLNYITFNKFSTWMKTLEDIPEVVKILEFKLIELINSTNTTRDANITSYSNGIESIGYKSDTTVEKGLLQSTYDLAKQYLYPLNPDLFYRGRWINARHGDPIKST